MFFRLASATGFNFQRRKHHKEEIKYLVYLTKIFQSTATGTSSTCMYMQMKAKCDNGHPPWRRGAWAAAAAVEPLGEPPPSASSLPPSRGAQPPSRAGARARRSSAGAVVASTDGPHHQDLKKNNQKYYLKLHRVDTYRDCKVIPLPFANDEASVNERRSSTISSERQHCSAAT